MLADDDSALAELASDLDQVSGGRPGLRAQDRVEHRPIHRWEPAADFLISRLPRTVHQQRLDDPASLPTPTGPGK
jgi:hypothetical protein